MTINFLDVSTLNGINGFVINGVTPGDASGFSVSNGEDIDGDGVDDIIIGAPNADFGGLSDAGEAFVVFGNSSGFASEINLSSLNGNNGFVIINTDGEEDNLGISVSNAGDINNDGFDDIIVGSIGGDGLGAANTGQAFLIFGDDDFSSTIDVLELDGDDGFAINGIETYDNLGISVSNAGDIDGDGFDDLIVGANLANNLAAGLAIGESYIVFGAEDDFPENIIVEALNSTDGFIINGTESENYAGQSVSTLGDINGDGFDDYIIGEPGDDVGNSENVGRSNVIFGQEDGFIATFDLNLIDGTNGFIINGIDAGDYSGGVVSGGGDFNGDGFDDILISSYGGDPNGINSGESYLIFGTDNSFGLSLDLSDLDGDDGFVLNGIDANDVSGISISFAGDINGDDFDDLIIGAYLADPNGVANAGESYVIFGTDSAFDESFELSSLDGSNGFIINGENIGDGLGRSVSGGGDVNGDGVDDLIIGAPYAGSNNAGETYVVFGNIAPELDLNGTPSGIDFSNTFDGTAITLVDETNFTLTDSNTDSISGATITITNIIDTDSEFLNPTTTGNIDAVYDPSTGILTLSGVDTIANYQQVLQTLEYDNTATTPTNGDRLIEFIIDDGQGFDNLSATATTTLTVNIEEDDDEIEANLDIDGNATADALTDGILILRFLFGFTEDSLTDGVIADDATFTTFEEIQPFLLAADETFLDVDENGETDALTDGILILRSLFGFTGDSLINGAIGDNANRTTATEIEDFIDSFLPVTETTTTNIGFDSFNSQLISQLISPELDPSLIIDIS